MKSTRRNKFIRILMFAAAVIIALSSLCFSSFARDGKVTVKVGFYTNRPNYMSALENGTMREGYGYEYVWLVSNFTGWNVEYVFGTADQLNEKLLNGEIDLLPFTSYSDDKEDRVLFPEHSMGSEVYNLYSKKETDTLSAYNLSSLNNKIIGVVNDTNAEEILDFWKKEKKISCYIFKYDSEYQRNNAFNRGVVDLIVETGQEKKRDWNTIYEIGNNELYLALSAKRADLLPELNEALHEIYATSENLNQNLANKYYTQNRITTDLSENQTKWLSEHNTVKIGYSEEIMNCVENTGDGVKGFLPDLIKRISQALGVNISAEYIKFDSDRELQEALTKDEVQVAYPVIADIYAGELSDYLPTSAVNSASMCIITKNKIGTYTINSLAETNSINLQHFSKSMYPDSVIVQSNSVSNSLRMLQDETVEGVVVPTKVFEESIKDKYEYGALYATNLSKLYEAALGVNKQNRELWTTLERALSMLGTEELNIIANQNNVQAVSFSANDVINRYYWVLILVFVVGTALVVIIVISNRQRKQKEIQNEILSAANRKAELASKAKSDFLFNMSHDIRTPMNAILGFTDKAIENADDSEKVRDSLNKVKISSNMLINIINDILDMSRIENGKTTVKEERNNIRNTFTGIETMANELASAKEIDVSFEIGKIDNEIYYSDFSLIERVLFNIVSNAIKFTGKGGFVKAKVEQIDSFNDSVGVYQYTVEDNGIGMSEEFQKHCFEQFTREQNSTVNSIQGTGLGLALAYSIVQTLHGTIKCESKQGVGSKFTIVLPLTISNASADELQISEKKHDYGILEGKKALLVEDNEFNKEITKDILSEKGITVFTADNGKEAVYKVSELGADSFDFILMDIQMPVMDGYEATRLIRKSNPDSNIPIIAISANAFTEDKQKSYASGMNAHLAKPLNKKVMFDTIVELLERNSEEL